MKNKREILNDDLNKEFKKDVNSCLNSPFFEDSIDALHYENYLSKYGFNEDDYSYYHEWLESVDRLREEKLNEIFGINKNPTFADVWNKNYHGK